MVAKYAWHLPLYRQAKMLRAPGLHIKRATLSFWVGYAAAELKPLYLRLRELILTAGKISVDETGARSRSRANQEGIFLAISRDDRPWGGTDAPRSRIATLPGAAPCMRSSCSIIIAASCNAMDMPRTRPLLRSRVRRSRSLFAGAICVVTFSISPRVATHRSRTKLLNASRRSMRSRRPSLGTALTSAVRYAAISLKGEKPADLPVQAPMKYQTVLNINTAKVLGINVPRAVLARVDEVIE